MTEVEQLKLEIELLRELVKAKDELIEVLLEKRDPIIHIQPVTYPPLPYTDSAKPYKVWWSDRTDGHIR